MFSVFSLPHPSHVSHPCDLYRPSMMIFPRFGGISCCCRLYAALAGVEDPALALFQPPRLSRSPPPIRRSLHGRRQSSNLLARSRTPGSYTNIGHLDTSAGSSSSNPTSSRSPPERADTPATKRARSTVEATSLPHAVVTGGTAAATSGRAEVGVCAFDTAETQQQPVGRRWPERADRNTWKMRLKGDLVTGREPSETFAFEGQRK